MEFIENLEKYRYLILQMNYSNVLQLFNQIAKFSIFNFLNVLMFISIKI